MWPFKSSKVRQIQDLEKRINYLQFQIDVCYKTIDDALAEEDKEHVDRLARLISQHSSDIKECQRKLRFIKNGGDA